MASEQDRADLAAMAVLIAGADRGFRSMDTFVSWFAGVSGATTVFLIANVGNVDSRLSAADVAAVADLVLRALPLILIAKLLGSLICARAGALEKAMEIVEKMKEPISPEKFDAAIKASVPRHIFLLTRHSHPNAITKRTLWYLSIAGLLSLAAAGLVLAAWFQLLQSI